MQGKKGIADFSSLIRWAFMALGVCVGGEWDVLFGCCCSCFYVHATGTLWLIGWLAGGGLMLSDVVVYRRQ